MVQDQFIVIFAIDAAVYIWYINSDEEAGARRRVIAVAHVKHREKQHALVHSELFSQAENHTVAIVQAPPGNAYAFAAAAVIRYNNMYGTNHFVSDAVGTCEIEWGEIELTAEGLRKLVRDRAEATDPEVDLFSLPPPVVVEPCNCSIGPEQDTCPHGFGRRHED